MTQKRKKVDRDTSFNKRFYILENQISVFKRNKVTQSVKPINY